MTNPRLATRYAKSLMSVAADNSQVDTVYNDMRYLEQLTKQSRDFSNLLSSPVITGDKKLSIMDTVIGGNVSPLTKMFFKLLIHKNREANLGEISSAFIDQYYERNNIHKVKLSTAEPISDELKNSILNRVRALKNIEHIDLETEIDPSLIGGFTLQIADTFVDASIKHDLYDIKRQFEDNHYVHNIR